MNWLRTWLAARRKPQQPLTVEISCNCSPVTEELFRQWLKNAIRRNGGDPGVLR